MLLAFEAFHLNLRDWCRALCAWMRMGVCTGCAMSLTSEACSATCRWTCTSTAEDLACVSLKVSSCTTIQAKLNAAIGLPSCWRIFQSCGHTVVLLRDDCCCGCPWLTCITACLFSTMDPSGCIQAAAELQGRSHSDEVTKIVPHVPQGV